MKIKSLRAFHLRSLNGFTCNIPANEAVDIPDACAKEAFAQGCIAVESDATPVPGPVATPATPDNDQKAVEARANEIHKAIDELIASNDRGNFAKDGTPKVAAVTKVLGHTVSAVEVEQVWATITNAPKQ